MCGIGELEADAQPRADWHASSSRGALVPGTDPLVVEEQTQRIYVALLALDLLPAS
jgi:hypothetical protein